MNRVIVTCYDKDMETLVSRHHEKSVNNRPEIYVLSGHVDNNSIVVNGNLSMYEGCDVIVTILDGGQMKNCEGTSKSDEKRKEAARSLAGVWSSHENTFSVEEEVRKLRRGRQFDN